MCMMMAGMALGVIGAIGQYAAQKQATDDYNAQAAAAHRDAQYAATLKYKDLDSKYIYDNKALQQQGYKSALNNRESIATGVASSGAMGIDPGSITIGNLVAQNKQQEAQNESNLQDKMDDARAQRDGQMQSVQAEAQQRINSVPFKREPSPLGAILGIGTSLVKGMGGGGMSGFNFDSMA
ncbi:hypothetical protein [Bradyrhizobium sp. SZCCHNRI2049]|uniref:virion core protein, T7 gp14 family n=1 Tax=Bradyrhizobium sp. SZCCHNRI2049 TaxID=3057287 RepID=UPI002915E2C0|nr:hypothetical protein [Bradyrhizobium sp. SZCCHNRI2049]